VSKPWIDHSLLKMINHKRQLWRNFSRSGAPSDYDIHRNFSNHLKNVINEKKTKFENNLLNNPKAFYGHLRKHLFVLIALKATLPTFNARSETSASRSTRM
jgi:hypothetical protein